MQSTSEMRNQRDELGVLFKKHSTRRSYINKGALIGAVGSLLFYMGQCTRSIVNYNPGKDSSMMKSLDSRLNYDEFNSPGQSSFDSSQFIAERPELLQALEEAQLASQKAYIALKKTPEYQQYSQAVQKIDSDYRNTTSVFLWGEGASAILYFAGNGLNNLIKKRKKKRINLRYSS